MLQVTKELLKDMTDTIVHGVNPRSIILFGSTNPSGLEKFAVVNGKQSFG